MKTAKAYFIDADYVVRDKETYVRLLLRGKRLFRLYYPCDPYFYAVADAKRQEEVQKVKVPRKDSSLARVKRIEVTKRFIAGEEHEVLKIFCEEPRDVPLIQKAIPFPAYEYGIRFAQRVLIDLGLIPFSIIRYEREGRVLKRILGIEQGALPDLRTFAFDIETYNPQGAPREKKDPVIMISYKTKNGRGVITTKKTHAEYVHICKDEKEMLAAFCDIVRKEDPDVLFGYNSSNFDIPYLMARAKENGVPLILGKTNKPPRKFKRGLADGMEIDGRIHVDLYPLMRFFGFIGLVKAQQFTLEKVYAEVMGKKKLMVARRNIWEMWDNGELEELAAYSMMDAESTYELGMHFIPLNIEFSILTKIPLFDTVLSTSGQMIENILMNEAARRGEIIPSKPSGGAVQERLANPIEGAYVQLPEPGIYENIAVLDFRGLYPSIISSYNIDPVSLALGKKVKKSECHVSPTGACFVKEPRALIPLVVDWLIDYRVAIKGKLKTLDKDSHKYKELLARSTAVKVATNTVYGYLAFPRSRWYSRECGESTTAWGRKHIMETIETAQKMGFKVIYSDTDSVMMIYKDKKDVLSFMEKINDELPNRMELELEGFYPRGVFVSKRGKEAKGAKKKYALLGDDGRIKIRGFELVRRDWSEIAKKTQLDVLNAILREGSKEKAVAIVRRAIGRLQNGEVPLSELAIETQIKKDPKDYEVADPAVSAAIKGAKRGVPVERGTIVSYVVTKKGKTISEKAELAEFAQDYDVDYYVKNQVLPAVLKILKELGYDETDLKIGGKQKGLMDF